jgi:hypothetical protein
VLARLDRLDGVERSFVNHTGTLLRLSLRPDGDADRVAEEAGRVLTDEADGVSATRLDVAVAGPALRDEEWRDRERVGELSVIEARTLIVRGLVALGLVAALLSLGVAWWRRRARSRSSSRAVE